MYSLNTHWLRLRRAGCDPLTILEEESRRGQRRQQSSAFDTERTRTVFCQENACHGGKKKEKKTLYNPSRTLCRGEPEADCGVYDIIFLLFVGLFCPRDNWSVRKSFQRTGHCQRKATSWWNVKSSVFRIPGQRAPSLAL